MTKLSILVVDDCENNLHSFKEALAPLNKPIITCKSGREALHIASNENISVILMDVQMPEMNGFEVVDMLKSRKSTRDIPVIFITAAYNSDEFMNRGYLAGGVDFITKPVDPFLLLSKVKVFQQLREQKSEIENLVTELQEKNSVLEETQNRLMQSSELVQISKLASLGTISAGICHEFNNPLTIIQGNLDLMKKHLQLNDFGVSRIHSIEKAFDRMVQIINHLEYFTREDTATDFEPLNIDSVISGTFQLFDAQLKHKNIDYVIEADEGLSVLGHKNRLENVFQNLITNSTHSFNDTPRGNKKISFHCSRYSDDIIQVRYRDNATGMSKEIQEKVFEPFFTTKEAGQGTGLGMSISYGIVKEHGGQISLDSKEGVGSCFIINLPAHSDSGESLLSSAS